MDTHDVLIVEDDINVQERLSEIIDAHPQLKVAAAIETHSEARHYLQRECPDVMLVDLGLPDGSGIDLIRQSRSHKNPPEAMVITVFGDERHVVSAIKAGATGYLLKDDDTDYIGEAIMDLLSGSSPISSAIARHVLKCLQSAQAGIIDNTENEPTLTRRETEILQMIARGFTYAEIAEILFISVYTVTSHTQHIYRKLEVKSRSEAVFEAVQLGIIQLNK